jgi:putative component of toxin-antitoxin plasmid stabilization module
MERYGLLLAHQSSRRSRSLNTRLDRIKVDQGGDGGPRKNGISDLSIVTGRRAK